MRALTLTLALALPTTLMAEDIPLTSRVSDVTLYPEGARVQREVPFTAPAGQHDLILLDLPQDTDLQSVRVSVTGATMGSVTTRRDAQPPRGERESAAIKSARDEVERREVALRDARADIERMRLAVDAANAEAAFLAQLGQGDGIATQDVSTLREMAQMIGAQTLAARQSAHDAARKADSAKRELKEQIKALEEAREALAALVPEVEDRAMLAISITAEEPTDGMVQLTYQTWAAGWSPVYDMTLTRDTGDLEIARGAYLRQNTGENWQDVALTLSTVRPSGQTQSSHIDPLLRRIGEPIELMRKQATGAQAEDMLMAESAPAFAVDTARATFDGLAVTYNYAPPVSVASGADALRIALGTLGTQAEIQARAVPLYDESAFLVAKFSNDMGELILPGETNLYLDETFVAQVQGPLIAAGAESEASFGPIDGLRLTRIVEDREEGGSGLIRKSSDLTETATIEVKNLTDREWPLRVLDRIPYSEQEALRIDWKATPRPDEVDVDGEKGILAWDFDLAPAASRVLTLSYEMQWPEDKVLR